MKNQIKARKGGCAGFLIKWFLIAFIIVFALVYFFAGKIVDFGVKEVSNLSGVKMSSSTSIGFSPFQFDMKDFTIKNPEGFGEGDAISFKQVRLQLALVSNAMAVAKSEPIVIDEVRIIAPYLSYEQVGLLSSNNLKEIQNKLTSLIPSSGEAKPKEDKSKEKGEPMKFIIKKIVFEDGKVGVKLADKGGEVPLPSFTITDLGVKENGVTAGEAAGKILMDVSAQALTSVAKDITKIGLDAVKEGSDKGSGALKDALKSILGD